MKRLMSKVLLSSMLALLAEVSLPCTLFSHVRYVRHEFEPHYHVSRKLFKLCVNLFQRMKRHLLVTENG